eukprot:2439326-Rhodomonas_salina.3
MPRRNIPCWRQHARGQYQLCLARRMISALTNTLIANLPQTRSRHRLVRHRPCPADVVFFVLFLDSLAQFGAASAGSGGGTFMTAATPSQTTRRLFWRGSPTTCTARTASGRSVRGGGCWVRGGGCGGFRNEGDGEEMEDEEDEAEDEG